jgi:hypothetical protein
LSESKKSKLEARIDELTIKRAIYFDVIAHVKRRRDENIEGSVGKQTCIKILNQLLSQLNQIEVSIAWNQKALQNLQNQQPQPSQ